MSVLTLADAKRHLNISGGGHDIELQAVIDAAEAAIAERCGPLTSVEQTERIRGGGTGLTLRETPVVSITSVTPVGGSAVDLDNLDVDETAGVIEWGSGARWPVGRYDVVYQAGRATCPDDLLLAVRELVRHLWETQRGPARRPGSTASDAASNTLPGAAYLWPFRVEQIVVAHEKVGI